jgi:hypothetical protein
MIVLRASGVLLFLALAGVLTSASQDQAPPLPDPFPLRRIVMPLERVPAELQRQGVLVQIPRAEFETKVREAAQASEAIRRQPRLVKTVYTAQWSSAGLTNGSGQWTVHHPGTAPGILLVPNLNLALSKVKLGGADAVLGELDGKNLGLWVEQSGTQAVYFDWSARAQPMADGWAFDLRLPACPQCILELKLPGDHGIVLGKNAGMLTGPLETEQPSQKLWRIQTTGRSQVEFVVRKKSEPSANQLVFATVESRQALAAGVVQADFDIQIEAVKHGRAEWIFDYDPLLQPYEVSVLQAELKSWDVAPATPETKGKATLLLRLREPKQGAFQARIRCLATRPANQEWRSPALRLRHAVARSETLHLVLPGAQPLDRWDAGQFRWLRTAAENDGGQTFSLVDLEPEAAAPRRPHFTFAPITTELHVHQQTRWTIASAGMTLDAEIACTVPRGQRFQLAVQLPPAPWQIDEVAWEPKDGLRAWTTAGSLLLVDLQRGLDARTPGKLTLRLRAPVDRSMAGSRLLSIPELMPLDAAERRATMALHVSPGLQATMANSSIPPELPDSQLLGPEAPPWFFFNYRNQPLTGTVRLQGPRTLAQVRVEQTATLSREPGELTTRLAVEPVVGQPTHLDVHLAAPLTGAWIVTGEAGTPPARWERRLGPETIGPLLQLGTQTALERLILTASLPRGESWRFHWVEPMKQRTTFWLRSSLSPPPGDQPVRRWDIPLLTAPAAEQVESEIVLHSKGVAIRRSEGRRLAPEGGADSKSARVFRWRGNAPAPELTVWTEPAAATLDAPPLFDHALLASSIDATGQCLHHFRFQAGNWSRPELPVILPAAARQVVAARLDGKWLDRLPPLAAAGPMEVRLPMPQDGKPHWFDLVYATDAAAVGGLLGWEVAVETPRLPAPPLRQHRVWRLAPGRTPLHQERFASLQHGLGSPAAWLRRLWHAADPLLDVVVPSAREEWLEPQSRALLDAETALHRKGLRDATLGESLQRLLFDHLKEQTALVLDRAALREAGLGPGSNSSPGQVVASGRPFWEAFGLVYVPTPAAPLLTTRQRWQDWRQGNDLPVRLTDEVADAVGHGQDALGSFCRADVWLRTEPAIQIEQNAWPAALTDWFARDWTEWAPRPASSDDADFIVIDRSMLQAFGLVAGAVLIVTLGGLCRRLSAANRMRVTIMLLVAALAALVAAPLTLAEVALWWVVALMVVLVFDYRRLLKEGSAPSAPTPSSNQRRQAALSGACILLAILAGGWFARAQTVSADVFTVYLVDAGPDRALALVRPELLKRLDEAKQKATQPVSGAVLTSATYQGKWRKPATDLQAQFDLYSFSDQAVLQVPMGGIELSEGAFLDGAPVFPTAAVGKTGFVAPIRGKGWHRLTLTGSVRHQTTGDSSEWRCTIPALWQSRLEWQAPTNLANLQVVRSTGETQTLVDAAAKQQVLHARLGHEPQLQVRWLAPNAAPTAADVEVREHYSWDLDPRGPALTAVLAYTPGRGALSRVELALPEATEVRRVEALGNGLGTSPLDWQVLTGGGPRRLAVDLGAPALGPFQLQVHLVPRGGMPGNVIALRLPQPLQAKPSEGVLAFRLEGWDVTDKTKNLGVTGLAPEVFRGVWVRTGTRETVAPTRAYSFRRAADNASLELTLHSVKPRLRLELDWQVARAHADLRAQAEWSSSQELMMVELLLPPGLRVQELQGPNVHHWGMQGQVLRAWLETPSKQAALTVLGAMTRQGPTFQLPIVQAPEAQSVATEIVLHAEAGWTIVPERLLHLKRMAEGAEARFQATQASYEGTFALRPAATAPSYQSFTTVEPRGAQVAVTTSLLGWLAQGDFPTLTVHWRQWSGSAPRLESSLPVVRREHRHKGDDHQWTVQLAPGGARMVLLQLHGQVESGKPFALPHVEIDGGKLVEQEVAWLKGALTVQEQRGLKEAKAGAAAGRQAFLAALAPRPPSQVWKVEQSDWQCVLAAPSAERARPGRILLAEQNAFDNGKGNWLHRADWLLLAHDLRDLRVQLPAHALALVAAVDGQTVLPRSPAAGAVEIPLPARAGVFHVRLLWRYPDGVEAQSSPLLTAARLPEVTIPVEQGAVYVPAGLLAQQPPAGFTAQESNRSAALARVSTAMCVYWSKLAAGDQSKAALAAWGSQFLQAVRHLEYRARLAKDDAMQAEALKLRKEHQAALAPEILALAKGADKMSLPWSVAPPQDGVPFYWTGEAPLPRLEPEPAAPWWPRNVLVLAAVGVFLLSWLPNGPRWCVRLWPEQLAGLAALGFVLWEISLIALLLWAVAAIGRATSALVWLRRPSVATPSTPPSSNPAAS